MNWVGSKKLIPLLFVVCIAMAVFSACSNSVLDVDADERDCVALISQEKLLLSVKSSSSKAKSSSSENGLLLLLGSSGDKGSMSDAVFLNILELDDKEYPYAGIPRVVIETENREQIKDRETEVPAKLQIWGEKKPESDVLNLTIRGRGNTSWEYARKKSYKIEFEKKQSILGMPKDKDWALIANYADKSLMRNFIAYRLSAALNAYYAPRCEFAELYLNGEYLGVYLLTETIKISENRVNIPKNDESYIVEFDFKYKVDEQVVFSDVLMDDGSKMAYRVHYPKNATKKTLNVLQEHIEKFENYLKTIKSNCDNNVSKWIDVDESVKHYWIQEYSRNPDANFFSSVYFSWVKGEKMKMGPAWDFDLAFGNHPNEIRNVTNGKIIRIAYWNSYLFNDASYKKNVTGFWVQNRALFYAVLDLVEIYRDRLRKPAENNFKKWKILNTTEFMFYKKFESYDEAVDDLKTWLEQRIQWLDDHEL